MRKPFNGDYPLTQGFGENPADYLQFGLKGHNGLDYGLPMRTEVLAPHSGKVIEATLDPQGYGLYIKIENEKEGSVLAHFAEFRVGVGDTVSEGQLIALSDTSGNSTGPHLHWGYYLFPRDRSNGYAGFIDQISLIGITNLQTELDKCRTDRDSHWNELTEARETIKNLNQQIQTTQGALTLEHNDNSNLKAQLTNERDAKETLQEQINQLSPIQANFNQLKRDYDSDKIAWNSQAETDKRTIAQLRNSSYKTLPTGELIKIVLARIFRIK